MKLFDSKTYDLHYKRAQRSFSHHAFLFEHIGYELTSRVEDIKKNFYKVLNWSPYPLPCTSHHHVFSEGNLPFEESSFDLTLSCLVGHWVNDLPGLLKSIHSCLQPEGLFIGALWGGRTLHELRESLIQAELFLTGGASPRIAPMLHPADAPQLLGKAGFFMPVVDTETMTVTYPSLTSLMRDLRGMGETNKLVDRPKTFTPRTLFEKAEEIYKDTFGLPGDKIPATFEAIYLTGWKKRPSSEREPI